MLAEPRHCIIKHLHGVPGGGGPACRIYTSTSFKYNNLDMIFAILTLRWPKATFYDTVLVTIVITRIIPERIVLFAECTVLQRIDRKRYLSS
jgi:hypothetical protein